MALIGMLVALWLLTHGYQGLSHDAQIYAFQALAKIHPAFADDLYLRNTSQDTYTVFSLFYASFVGRFGLEQAALSLTVLFTLWFLAAAWSLARNLSSSDAAWVAAAFLIITVGDYGAFSVFNFSEDYLSARLPAEALVVTALNCHFRGHKRVGLLIAVTALFVHPLMAFPGLLLLLCLWLPSRVGLIGAVIGILGTLIISVSATAVPTVGHVFTIMDSPWLDVVRERSQFLFLQLWTHKDWQLNARPFASLTITAMVIENERIRKLCLAGMLVGGAGLTVALIASLVGPVAILVQGQAWRWVWIASFVSVLLLAPTVLCIWQDKKCGPICAILLVSGWTFSAVDGTTCVVLALILWTQRAHITCQTTHYLRWAAVALVIVIITWVAANSWTIVSTSAAESGREPLLLQRTKNILGLQIPAVLIVWLLWHRMTRSRSLWMPTLTGGVLLASSICILPWSFKQSRWIGSPSEISEFADWRRVIPPTSSVFVAPTQDTGAFVWFTLGRPNYLSISQSAGVVFSRETALEVARRSQVLLPLVDPSWKIMTGATHNDKGKQRPSRSPFRPLTEKSLISVCSDPQLGFVISPEDVGFDPIRHTHAGAWKDWNLYDCQHVRSLSPTA